MHNDQIPYRPDRGAAVGAQRGLADALERLVKTHNNFEARPPLKLEAENGHWVLSVDPAYSPKTRGYTGTIAVDESVGVGGPNANGYYYVEASYRVWTYADGLLTDIGAPVVVRSSIPIYAGS